MLLENNPSSHALPHTVSFPASAAATGGSSEECYDIPTDTPRFRQLHDAASATAPAASSALSDSNIDAATESDLGSLNSGGSNSARNSGRCPHPPAFHLFFPYEVWLILICAGTRLQTGL
jgi:hypothetical protein